jgi:hypothetical protein
LWHRVDAGDFVVRWNYKSASAPDAESSYKHADQRHFGSLLEECPVTVEVRNLTAKLLDVQIVPPPAPLSASTLRQLFADLGNFNLEVFQQTPDGGAVLSNPSQFRQVVIAPPLRQVAFPVQIDPGRTLDEIVQVLELVHSRAPASTYVACVTSITAHLPVTGESAAALLQRKAFQNDAAYAALGPGVQGVGFRAFMVGPGPFTFSVEPLMADLGKIVIQLQQVVPGNFQLNELRGKAEATLHFYNHQLRNFLEQLLADS